MFRGMFVKLGITGKESSAFGGFTFPIGEGKRGFLRLKFNFYFLGRGHFKYLYLCGGTPKIIKILVVVPQIIDRVPTPQPQVFFPGKALSGEATHINFIVFGLTRPGLEPTIYRTRGEHANHYTTDAVHSPLEHKNKL